MPKRLLTLLAALALAPLAVAADPPPAPAAAEEAKPSQGSYVLVVGVGETADKTIAPRPTADADARALYDLFADPKYFDVKPDRIVLLTAKPDDKRSAEATKANILKALHEAVAKTGKDDTLIIAMFGRGASAGDRTCLFAADSTFKDRLKDGVLGNDLETELKAAKTQKLALLMDIHFKGYDPGTETLVEPTLRDVLAGVFGGEEKGESPAPHDKIVVLSSVPSTDPIATGGHGLFAATLIDALKGKADVDGYEPDGIVTVDEAVKYLEKEVADQARKLGKTQKEKEAVPFVVGEEFSHFRLTKNPAESEKVGKRLAALAKLAADGKVDKETAEEGERLLTRMPKLKNAQDRRKRFQELADGSLKVETFGNEYNRLKLETVLPQEDADGFAKKVGQAILMVNESYVKVSNPGELAAAAVRGVYRRVEAALPAEVEASLKTAKGMDRPEWRALLADARLRLGKREDLADNKDADIAVALLLASLGDPYTTYYDRDTIKKLDSQLRGVLRGVGIQIRRDLVKDALLVVSPIKGSPAYKAGIQAGDHIVGIKRTTSPQGEPLKADEPKEFSTAGMKTESALDIILGKPGTPITLVIERRGEKRDVDLVRAQIGIETVLGVERTETDDWNFWLDEKAKIAYVQLTQFAPQTTTELAALMRKLGGQGVRGLVLDLRFNPGGVLDGAIGICAMFVESGKVVSVRPRVGQERSFHTRDVPTAATYTKFPIAILINGNSASASEIVAACLQDQDGRAKIVGERSYGKGSVQNVAAFRPTDGQIKMTTARYFPPSGRNIDKLSADPAKPDEWGVRPDEGYEVKLTKDQQRELADHFREREAIPAKDKGPADAEKSKEKKPFKDVQLEKAVEYVREQMKPVAAR